MNVIKSISKPEFIKIPAFLIPTQIKALKNQKISINVNVDAKGEEDKIYQSVAIKKN